ncbi:hypothetical protein D2E22_0215 [Bifidobacterium castoris]|uniref:Uncharacterized protein n=1 Tax=Bifidobacterium castoris TaxID=2306972 RepID=A0A430FA91_9BIFI|nr:hypothetical protein D2E22_0215 [Bifidobacterium castoris]
MKDMMRMMTIPGLDTSRKLEELRQESMRTAQRNLRKQTKARTASLIMAELADRRKATLQ